MDQLLQTVLSGRLQAVSDRQRSKFIGQDILNRFWSKDLALWAAAEPEREIIRHNLAWVDLPDTLEPLLVEIARATDACLREGLLTCAVLGCYLLHILSLRQTMRWTSPFPVQTIRFLAHRARIGRVRIYDPDRSNCNSTKPQRRAL